MSNKKRTFNLHDDQTLWDMMRLFNNVSSQFQPFYDEQTKLFDFTVAALQWDKQVRETLRSENRPANSYNLIRTILNVIFAVERDNRKKGKASPRTGGDNELALAVTQTLDYYLYHSGFKSAQKRVFMDTIIARMGVYHIGWEYNGSSDDRGMLFTKSIDPREIMAEPNYNDPLWMKSSFLFRKHSLSLEEILNTFALNDSEMQDEVMQEASLFFERDPKRTKWVSQKLKSLFSAVYETATGFSSTSQDTLFKNYLQWWDPQTGKFDVLELHEQRTERRLIVPENGGKRIVDITDVHNREYQQFNKKAPDGFSFDPEIINNVRKRYNLTGQAKVDLLPRKFQTAVIPTFNLKVSEQAYPIDSDYYVYIPQVCYDYHSDPLKVQSVMDDLVDPQSDFNKSKSLILELLGRYANKGWIMDENAISGLEEDWETNKIAPYRRVRAGYINMIKPEEGQTINPDLIRMPLEMQQLMKVITNADDEIRGQRSSDVKSGKHFIAKEERQAKSFTYILENRDNAQQALYSMALSFIQHYVTTQQVIRITSDIGQANGKSLEINKSEWSIDQGHIQERVINDIDATKFDIEITDEPYSTTAQQDRYDKLGDLFNATVSVNQKKADALLDILVEVGNFPEAQKILAAWNQMEQPSPEQRQMQAVMQRVQMIMLKLGIEEKQIENFKTQVETLGLQLDNEIKEEEIDGEIINNALALRNDGNNGNGNGKREAATQTK
jgi:hypothetical protein